MYVCLCARVFVRGEVHRLLIRFMSCVVYATLSENGKDGGGARGETTRKRKGKMGLGQEGSVTG